MRLLLATLPLFLAGCGNLQNLVATPYEPIPIRIYDQAKYEAAVTECRTAGNTYKSSFSLGDVITRIVRGATSNTSLIPVSPLVPVYGAAGGAVGAASDGLDLMSAQHQNVFRNCLLDETRHDGSAIIANPEN